MRQSANGKKKPVSHLFSVRLKTPVFQRLQAQAEKEGRPMGNLAAVFIQAGLDDRNRGRINGNA